MKNPTDRKHDRIDSKLRLADIEDLRGAFGAEGRTQADPTGTQAAPAKTVMCVNW